MWDGKLSVVAALDWDRIPGGACMYSTTYGSTK